jgi:hypothetical protein
LEEIGLESLACMDDATFSMEAKDRLFQLLEKHRVTNDDMAKVLLLPPCSCVFVLPTVRHACMS